MRKIWGLISDNFLLKLFSLILAFFIWFYIHTERTAELPVTVELTLVAPTNTILLSEKVSSFEILLEGPKEVIQSIPNPIEIIEQCKAFSSSVVVEEQKLDLPPGVSLKKKMPEIKYHIEKTITLSLAVNIETTNDPPSGYYQGKLSYSPMTVSVTGPESALTQNMSLSTEPVNLSGKTASFDTLVRISNTFGNPSIIIEDKLIRVKVEIFPEEIEREFEIPVTVIEEPRFPFIVKSVTERTVKITVRGAKNKVSKLKKSDLLVLVDISYLKTKGIHTEIPTKIVLPNGISLIGSSPRVQVHLISPSESLEPAKD